MKPVTSSAGPTVSPRTSTEAAEVSRADTDRLLHKAHSVLVHYVPGAMLPNELARVRAMLDEHMFGQDKRAHRDDVVEVARQIDRILPPPVLLARRRKP